MTPHLADASATTRQIRSGAAPDTSSGRRVLPLLAALPLFDGVPLDAADDPFREAPVLGVPPGTVLFEAGRPATMLYIVVSGRVGTLLGSGPTARPLATAGRGDTIGLAALLRHDVHPVTAVVLDEALLVGLPASTVARLIAERPPIAARLIGDMAAKLARLVGEIGGLAPRSARARVARMLVDVRRDATDADAEIGFAEPKRAIAARLAMTPETLSRELHALAALGLIESRRTRFRVLDATGLARAADDAAAVRGPA